MRHDFLEKKRRENEHRRENWMKMNFLGDLQLKNMTYLWASATPCQPSLSSSPCRSLYLCRHSNQHAFITLIVLRRIEQTLVMRAMWIHPCKVNFTVHLIPLVFPQLGFRYKHPVHPSVSQLASERASVIVSQSRPLYVLMPIERAKHQGIATLIHLLNVQ